MRLDVNKLSSAVRLALSLGAVATAGTLTAQAQTATADESKSQSLETIVVTGSNIRRVDIETANPVVTIDSKQIQSSGKLTIGDLVQELPATMNGTNPQVNNGGGSGSSTVSLRGLGSQRTLVLIDGHHILNRDLNTIPIVAVERIEVLTSGASAIYGSDAIGGVVNVILKDTYQGAQFSTDYGISDHDDGERKGYHFFFGQTSDKGSLMAGIDYNKTDSVLQSHRQFSKNSISLYGTQNFPPQGFVGGSSFGAGGNIQLPPGNLRTHYGCSRVALNSGASGLDPLNDYHCFGNSDKYNYASVNLLMTPQERTTGFIKGTYKLTDNIEAYFSGIHNKTSSGFQLAPSLYGSLYGASISKDSLYNPFGVDYNGSGGYDFRLRLVAAGNRAARNNNTTDQYSTGFRGNFSMFDQDWNWEAGVDYGHQSTVSTTLGLPNIDQLNAATGPSMLVNGVPTCVGTAGDPSTAVAGCVPFNPFNSNTPDQRAILAGIASPALTNVWQQEKVSHIGFNGGLFNLPAGTVQLAVGGSYRKEYINSTVDSVLQINPATGNCTLGSQCSSALQGGYNVKEAYGELLLPILKDVPFANSLNVNLSDRYSKYNTFGSTNNAAIGVEWRPIADLLLRGNYNKVFRAPQIGDIYGNPISSAPKLSSDPCTGITVANPACAGVPLDGSFTNTDVQLGQQIKAVSSGSAYANFPLGPETGATFNWGFVYSPQWVQGLSVSVDLWRVYLNNTITSVGAQAILDNCFAGQLQYCPLITRFGANSTAPGQIAQILQPTANLGRLDTKGADFSVKYRLPEFSFGQFAVGLDTTYLAQYNQNSGTNVFHNAGHVTAFGSAAESSCPDLSGGVCTFPRWRALATVNWNMGPWDASWRMRYIGKFRLGSGKPSEDSFPAGTCYYGDYCTLHGYQIHYGARTYNDLQVGYNIEPLNTRVDVGVDNVGDIQPPFLYANNTLNANTDTGNFDTLGRFYWARVTVKF